MGLFARPPIHCDYRKVGRQLRPRLRSKRCFEGNPVAELSFKFLGSCNFSVCRRNINGRPEASRSSSNGQASPAHIKAAHHQQFWSIPATRESLYTAIKPTLISNRQGQSPVSQSAVSATELGWPEPVRLSNLSRQLWAPQQRKCHVLGPLPSWDLPGREASAAAMLAQAAGDIPSYYASWGKEACGLWKWHTSILEMTTSIVLKSCLISLNAGALNHRLDLSRMVL